MKDKVLTLENVKKLVKPIAEKYHVEEIYLFGSYARGEANRDSEFYNTVMKERLLVA